MAASWSGLSPRRPLNDHHCVHDSTRLRECFERNTSSSSARAISHQPLCTQAMKREGAMMPIVYFLLAIAWGVGLLGAPARAAGPTNTPSSDTALYDLNRSVAELHRAGRHAEAVP